MTRHRPGAFAEEVVLPANHAIAMPEGMDFEAAAGFRSAFATAYHGLVQAGRLAAGETALIHGAAGGMGHAAIQVAKRLGATVIATAADAEKRAALVGLADHVLDYREDLAANVKSLTEDRGVDVVFDPVGGAVLEDSMRCLNWGARLVIVGFTTGRPSTIKTNHLLIKGASAIGIRVGEFGRHNPETYEENLRVLLDWAERGEIKTHISHRFKLDQVAEAFAAIAAREVVGKVVLTR